MKIKPKKIPQCTPSYIVKGSGWGVSSAKILGFVVAAEWRSDGFGDGPDLITADDPNCKDVYFLAATTIKSSDYWYVTKDCETFYWVREIYRNSLPITYRVDEEGGPIWSQEAEAIKKAIAELGLV